MTDDARLQAIIADMRDIERAHVPHVDYWTPERISEMLNGAEADRLTTAPASSPEVDRLAQIAAEESPPA